jgi:hypothetical protein
MSVRATGVGVCASAVLMAVLAGCGPGAPATPPASPPPSLAVAVTAVPSDSTPSPLPTVLASPVDGQPSSSATPSPSEATSTLGPTADAPSKPPSSVASVDWYPWLPPIDQSIQATLPLDSFVRTTSVVPVSAVPGGPPYRFDTGELDPADQRPLMGLPPGGLMIVVHGPVVLDDLEWYVLTPAQIAVDFPTGWVPLTDLRGRPYVVPDPFSCPSDPISSSELVEWSLTDGLPACYGADIVTIVGRLDCGPDVDQFVIGPSWLASGACRFDGPPTVYGLDPDLPDGRYAVTGRFLHPDAARCRPSDGASTTEALLSAVLHCRRAFVASTAAPA